MHNYLTDAKTVPAELGLDWISTNPTAQTQSLWALVIPVVAGVSGLGVGGIFLIVRLLS